MNADECEYCGQPTELGRPYCGNCGARTKVLASPMASPEPTYPGNPPAASGINSAGNGVSHAMLGSPVGDQSQGEAAGADLAPNETYLGNRLLYGEKRTDFDPLTNSALLRALLSRAIAMTAVWFVGAFLLTFVFIVTGVASMFNPASAYGTSRSAGSPFAVYFVFMAIWSAIWAGIFWFARLGAELSEWMLAIDGRAQAAPAALNHMRAIITARRSPISHLAVVDFHGAGGTRREYLQVAMGRYHGFVSCFPYGADLFIGWTFWIHIAPAQWFGLMLRRILWGGSVRASLTFDDPKAMREMLHGAVREGVDVATGRMDPTGGYSTAVRRDIPVIVAKASDVDTR